MVSTKEQRQRYKICILLVVLMLGFIPTIIAQKVIKIISIRNLRQFDIAGFYLLQYYPTTAILEYALANKYYCDLFPND